MFANEDPNKPGYNLGIQTYSDDDMDSRFKGDCRDPNKPRPGRWKWSGPLGIRPANSWSPDPRQFHGSGGVMSATVNTQYIESWNFAGTGDANDAK
jgi:hypothetical protein